MSPDDHRFDHHKMHALIGPEREARWDPPRFLSRLAIQSGQSVLDLGSGPGFWSLPLAEIVGANGTIVEQVTKYLHETGFTSVMQTWQDDDTYLLEAR